MTSPPSSSDVYNNAAAMRLDSRTPGLNSVITAWQGASDFTGGWSQRQYNSMEAATQLIREIYT